MQIKVYLTGLLIISNKLSLQLRQFLNVGLSESLRLSDEHHYLLIESFYLLLQLLFGFVFGFLLAFLNILRTPWGFLIVCLCHCGWAFSLAGVVILYGLFEGPQLVGLDTLDIPGDLPEIVAALFHSEFVLLWEEGALAGSCGGFYGECYLHGGNLYNIRY